MKIKTNEIAMNKTLHFVFDAGTYLLEVLCFIARLLVSMKCVKDKHNISWGRLLTSDKGKRVGALLLPSLIKRLGADKGTNTADLNLFGKQILFNAVFIGYGYS